jgi:D-alanyl-D-alanine carboxypeptidase
VQANPMLLYKQAPNVSAKFWAIFDTNKQSFIYGKREYVKREVASLTKMMTAFTVIDLARQYKLKLSEVKIKVCSIASNIRGTTAELKQGDIFTAE